MRYHTNFIGSLFGLFGGQTIVAEPEVSHIAGMPEVRIKILRSIARTDRLMAEVCNDDTLVNHAIKADKLADYQEKMLRVNGYQGAVDFAAMHEIHEDMENDRWLK